MGNPGLGDGDIDTDVFVGRAHPNHLVGIHGPNPNVMALPCVQSLALECEIFGPTKQALGAHWAPLIRFAQHDRTSGSNPASKSSRRRLEPCRLDERALEVGSPPQDEKVYHICGGAMRPSIAGWQTAQVEAWRCYGIA